MSDSKKDNSSLSLTSGDTSFRLTFSGFLKNDHHTFVVQKTEKLASALYLLTNHLGFDEPLRTRLRLCALDLVSCTTDGSVQTGSRHELFGSRCLEIGTILKLAERANLISAMNVRILTEEYAHLASFVREHKERIFDGVLTLSQGHMQRPPEDVRSDSTKGHIKDGNSSNGKRHSNRQKLILDLLAKKDKITVKDAKDAIAGCSEKTLQREIMALVEDGVLIKEGERRWSTYRKSQTSL